MDKYTAAPAAGHTPVAAQALAEHEGLVHWVVRRQWLGDLPYAEALHVGRIGLWRALLGYDPSLGYAFSTYAVPAIARAIWRAVERAKHPPQEVLIPYPPEEAACPPLVEDSPPDQAVEGALIQEALYRLVGHLPRPLDRVIVARYGLTGVAPQTFTVIGRSLGVTRQRAHQLHTEALLWLGHPAHSLTLRQCLGRNTVADYRAYLARLRAWQRRKRGTS